MKFNLGTVAVLLIYPRRPPFSPVYRLISHQERNRFGTKNIRTFRGWNPIIVQLPFPLSAPSSHASFDKAADPWNCTDCKLRAIFAGSKRYHIPPGYRVSWQTFRHGTFAQGRYLGDFVAAMVKGLVEFATLAFCNAYIICYIWQGLRGRLTGRQKGKVIRILIQ